MASSSMNASRRFSGLDRLYGVVAASKIRGAHIAVIGVGGVGSWVAEALARSGLARLTLIDFDQVAESNINRQVQATTQTIGQAKVCALKERIALINPDCQVLLIEDFVSPENWPKILPNGVDVVIDACDQMRAKEAMAVWAMKTKRRLIICGAAGGKRLPQRVEIADLSEVSHDPLLANLRSRLRRLLRNDEGASTQQEGIHARTKISKSSMRMNLMCVFSREPVAAAHASCQMTASDGSLNCHGYGSSVAVTCSVGMAAAAAAMEQLGI
jgi:tRNA threonylcarbamoyladenosine dehydratase